MDKPSSFAHKVVRIFCFSGDQNWHKFSVLPVRSMVVSSTLSLVGSGRCSIVVVTNGSQCVGGYNLLLKVVLSLRNGEVMW